MSTRYKPNSSLVYQVLLKCSAWYGWAMVVAELLLFWYKAALLPYPNRSLVSEILLFLLLAAVDGFRNFFGQKGNLTENVGQVVISLVLSVPCLLCEVYFLLWQTFVLKLDLILFALQIGLLSLQIIFGSVAIASVARAPPLS